MRLRCNCGSLSNGLSFRQLYIKPDGRDSAKLQRPQRSVRVFLCCGKIFGSATPTTHVGGDPDYGQYTSGYLQNFRVTKVVRCTANFTPPAVSF